MSDYRQTTEATLAQVGRNLELAEAQLAQIRTSIERCEALPSLKSYQLLNLPVRVGKVLEH